MSDERDQGKFNARLPPGMRERIAKEAKANNRSMNAEIVARLAASFERRQLDLSDEGIIAVLKRVEGAAAGLEALYMRMRDESAAKKKGRS